MIFYITRVVYLKWVVLATEMIVIVAPQASRFYGSVMGLVAAAALIVIIDVNIPIVYNFNL